MKVFDKITLISTMNQIHETEIKDNKCADSNRLSQTKDMIMTNKMR